MRRLESPEYASVKEYLSVGGTYEKIAALCEIDEAEVRLVDETPHFKAYKELGKIPQEFKMTKKDRDDFRRVMINLTEAIVAMTARWATMEQKLDAVIEPQKPWVKP